jgi:AcrR family transcriptional regulator
MSDEDRPDARTRALDAAEGLFAAKGFDSVTLRDISSSIGLTHAALYYHFPGGKEELFALVMERNIRRHGAGLSAAIDEGGPSLRGKLRGAASWFISQPPMNLNRMAQSDLAAFEPAVARRLMDLVYELILRRIQIVLAAARDSGEVGPCDPGLLAGGLLGLIESLHSVPVHIVKRDLCAMGFELIDVVLKGIDYKETGYAGS